MSRHASKCTIRPARSDDLAALVALNQADLPHLSALTIESLARLGQMATYFLVAELDGVVAGFVLAMSPAAGYESINFRWFKSRYPSFLYIDRVVIAQERRRAGVASSLYRDLVAHAEASGAQLLACEVNVRPPNPGSLAFHARHGFVEVGTQDTEDGGKTVSLQIRRH